MTVHADAAMHEADETLTKSVTDWLIGTRNEGECFDKLTMKVFLSSFLERIPLVE